MSRKEYNKQYYLLNKEKMIAQTKEYSKTDKAKTAAKNKYKTNIVEERARQKKQRGSEVYLSWRERNKESIKKKSKAYDLRKQFGITLEDYNQMFNNQNGCCAICNKHQGEFKKALAVDHNHSTGKIRGLLCFKCNTFLGKANDDVNVLSNAIKYLNNNE